jgi:hypothetical protein
MKAVDFLKYLFHAHCWGKVSSFERDGEIYYAKKCETCGEVETVSLKWLADGMIA